MNGHGLYRCIWCQKTEDQRTGKHHDRTGTAHENGSHGGTDIAIAFGSFDFPGTDALTNQCGCRHAKAVSRHIAQAFRCDTKRVGSDGSSAQWRNDFGGHDHGTIHGNFLYRHRHSNLECLF